MNEVYDIYHDESREESYWHGFLFVPRSKREYLLSLLRKSREGVNWHKPISFKDIGNRTGPRSPRVRLAESWLNISLASFQQQKLSILPTSFCICGSPQKYFLKLNELIKCKFVVFKERDNHKKMFAGLSKQERIETTFRMGIKGGVHRLFNKKNPITIGNVFIDKFGYGFDVNRSLRRFAREKREYVSFLKDSKLIQQHSDHRKIRKNQNSNDSQFLQLCDILIGAVRFHSYCPDRRKIKYKISWPCKILLERDTNNEFRMKQSRFFNSFTLGETWLEDRSWQFGHLKLGEDKVVPRLIQLKLPNF